MKTAMKDQTSIGNSNPAPRLGCRTLLAACCAWLALDGNHPRAAQPPVQAEVQSASLQGNLEGDTARLVIQANLKGWPGEEEPPIYGAAIQHAVRITREKLAHSFTLEIDAIRGHLEELELALAGDGELRQVTGDGLEHWSVRQAASGARFLVLRLKQTDPAPKSFKGRVLAETMLESLPATPQALTLMTGQPALANGFVRLEFVPELDVQAVNPTGLVPIQPGYLPETLRPADPKADPEPLAFRFHGTTYSLPLKISVADPEARQVVLRDAQLIGRFGDDQAAFTFTATARVKNPKGGQLELLRGGVALTGFAPLQHGRLRIVDGQFVAQFDEAGEFPLRLEFRAGVRATNGWNELEFGVAPSALQPVTLEGLAADTQFRFAGAARPERLGTTFTSYLPPDGRVELAWQERKPEAEGRLFYAAEGLSQITVSPGLLRQTVLLDLKVMQGELNRVVLLLEGPGEVTRVQGAQVLAWNLEPGEAGGPRRLVIQFNQAQKDLCSLQIHLQRSLGAFPQAVDAVQVQPDGATRFGGYVRVVNEGAVRLEVLQASGLSQISPEQVPQTAATQALLPAQTSQTFAFRFSGADFQLQVQADNILPELAVSQVLAYHLGEIELAIDAEIELDVREAPLRELLVHVPKGYAIARLNASGLSDYFLTDTPGAPEAQLRLVYASPVLGRQVIQLRLERNEPLGESRWVLPRLEVTKAKSARGHVGVSADAGFRLTPATTQGLTELATAFFPKKLAGIQAAYRLTDPAWQATLNVERLPQSIQADVFHLFSVAEGIAYGSSLVNYLVTGAPVATFKLEVSAEYFNVEFTGKNIRSWQKTDGSYLVQLHTPVSGTYTLLATYERPFKAQGERLTFTGARPLEAQSEQGHTVVVSAYQFQVQPVNVSASLTPLEPGEVPAEHRLLFDAPILSAYRYSTRPFNLELELKPLAQGEIISQVVDRAALATRISEEGQVVTDARYFVKNKGTPHLHLALPADAELWSVTVNGAPVVPVKDQRGNLIPLPQHADPNTVNDVQVKLAWKAPNPKRIKLGAPVVSAPVLLAEWTLTPDTGQRLLYRGGSLTPVGGFVDSSGFAGLARLWSGRTQDRVLASAVVGFGLLVLAALLWRSVRAANYHRGSVRHIVVGLLGLAASVVAVITLLGLLDVAPSARQAPAAGLQFLAPVQQADAPLEIELSNVPLAPSLVSRAWSLWPAALAVVVWLYSFVTAHDSRRKLAHALAWTLLAWTALRQPNGVGALIVVAVAFVVLEILWPGLRQWWRVPEKPAAPAPPATPSTPAAPAATSAALLLWGAWLTAAPSNLAQPAVAVTDQPPPPPIAEYVTQNIRVEDEFVFSTAKIRWQALSGQVLPVLHGAGVLTQSEFPAGTVRLVQVAEGNQRQHLLVAEKAGAVEVELQYQTRVAATATERGFLLPTYPGLVNRVVLTVVGLEVDLAAPQAVSVQRDPAAGTNTVATLILAPVPKAWIAWKPRSRDVRREKAVFYAELFQLYVPGAGVVEGLHEVQIRPAQGELNELAFDIPTGSTVTDVMAPVLAWWRFDPDARRLRMGLNSAQSRPFSLLIKSQIATGPLPFEQAAGLVSVVGAAGQLGLAGVATSSEVQLDDVFAEGFSPINLEDFPASTLEPLRAQVAGLTLRRGFRYAATAGTLKLKAAAVEPDVRVESQQTLSLGEDRTLLAATLDVEITRAGIFKLSFVLPPNLDVESISGAALSHWTDLKTAEGRVVTLHLKGKTEGQQQFSLSLAGPGVRTTQGWPVPHLVLREASKQRGQLLVVPEQGMRLQAATREGVTQLDPLKSGVRQKGVLAFRLLQAQWQLTLDLEQVNAWIQVTSLQHVQITEAQLKIAANLQYEIENTGVKAFRVRLPAPAENVRFAGEQVADFLPREEAASPGLKDWDVKLHRRVIGKYLLAVTYTVPLGAEDTQATVAGVQALEVNLQRGFLTLEAGGRRQVRIETLPPTLQPTEWQVIPRALQQDIRATAANYTFRLVEADVQLPVRLDRHEAARLLPARVNRLTLTSAIADDGVMLTEVQLELVPGDKRLLELTLPPQARFWFAFVNQNSVWPWNEQDRILIPLEKHSKLGEPTTVEFFYTSRTGPTRTRSLDLELLGPKFDLPLENITWRLYLSDKWQLTDSIGSLQLQREEVIVQPVVADLNAYIQNEAALRQEKTREAEQFLSLGNQLLVQGDPQQARRAFQAAYGLSQHDNAFNEDARVQLHNLKMQQALVGLNVAQAKVAGQTGALAVTPRGLREGPAPNYTQEEAKQLLSRNTAEDNAIQMRLAERLIQQQDAAVAKPAAIRATVPERGRLLTFTRPLEVNRWADLRIGLEAVAVRVATAGAKFLVLLGIFLAAAILIWLRRGRTAEAPPA